MKSFVLKGEADTTDPSDFTCSRQTVTPHGLPGCLLNVLTPDGQIWPGCLITCALQTSSASSTNNTYIVRPRVSYQSRITKRKTKLAGQHEWRVHWLSTQAQRQARTAHTLCVRESATSRESPFTQPSLLEQLPKWRVHW